MIDCMWAERERRTFIVFVLNSSKDGVAIIKCENLRDEQRFCLLLEDQCQKHSSGHAIS